jgi:hypothetical protein
MLQAMEKMDGILVPPQESAGNDPAIDEPAMLSGHEPLC